MGKTLISMQEIQISMQEDSRRHLLVWGIQLLACGNPESKGESTNGENSMHSILLNWKVSKYLCAIFS